MALITIQNAAFGYHGSDKRPVFENVDFSAAAGDVLCLLGPNGTGKSTILKCLCGILSLNSGGIFINGKSIECMHPAQIARHLAYVPQSLSSAFPFPVKEIVVMGRASHIRMFSAPSREDTDIASAAMERTGILHIAERPCNGISGGEWQLTLIARALAQGPDILLLDEPTSHLDLGNQIKILDIIHQLAGEGMTIIMATHFPDHAFISASHVAILNGGGIIDMGVPEDVISESVMKAVYGVDVRIIHIAQAIERKICVPLLKGGK